MSAPMQFAKVSLMPVYCLSNSSSYSPLIGGILSFMSSSVLFVNPPPILLHILLSPSK